MPESDIFSPPWPDLKKNQLKIDRYDLTIKFYTLKIFNFKQKLM